MNLPKKEQRKKILYIHHSGAWGGAPKSMSYIIQHLNKNEFESKLINISEGPINDFFRKELSISLHVVKGVKPFHGSTVAPKGFKLLIRNYLYLFPSLFNAYKIIKKEKPDLIHLNSTCLFVFSIAAKMLHIPVIVHVREPLRKGFWGAPLRFFTKKTVNGIIAISKYDLRSLNLPNSMIYQTVIYNFVDEFYDGYRQGELKQSLGINPDNVVFLYLARFAKGNGWKELIHMAKHLTLNNPKLHFVLAGSNDSIDVNKYRTNNIHIIPFQAEINSLLRGADIFVCPFTEPHFARGVIEASAFSLPVIGADIGGVNELIVHGKTGYLYSSRKEFLEYALRLANNEELRNKLGKAGYQHAIKKFNFTKNLEETYSFYNKICHEYLRNKFS
ncbi:MAG: glycosyltransferase family 4 protein [Chitinophagaceae bacterium]|nr:glycosyltransferase family 4 protein [Chitinophagaceae bacterium]